jgi:hypothetical protein
MTDKTTAPAGVVSSDQLGSPQEVEAAARQALRTYDSFRESCHPCSAAMRAARLERHMEALRAALPNTEAQRAAVGGPTGAPSSAI